MKKYLGVLAAASICVFASASHAAAVEDARTVAASASLAARLPDAVEFVVPAAGQITVNLEDLQNQVAFTKLEAVVTRGATKVATFVTPGTQQFQATAGSYRIHVVGKVPSGYGLFRVEARTASGQVLAASTAQIAAGTPVGSGSTPVRHLLQPGTYQVALRDTGFPAALQFADLAVFAVGGNGVPLLTLSKSSPADCVSTSCTGTLTVSQAGSFDFAVGAAAAANPGKGLYTLSITGPGTVVSADAYPVGDLPAPLPVTLPAAGDYALTLSDFLAPASALGELRALLVQGASMLGGRSGEGVASALGASAGAAKLFILSAPGSTGIGAFGVQLRRNTGQLVFETAGTAPAGLNTAQTAAGYRFEATVPAAGEYRLVLRDLQFPSPFSTLRMMVVQGGSVNSLGAPGTLAASLSAGPAIVLVTTTKSASSDGMLGVALEPTTGSSAALLSKTQGVGGLFDTRSVQITEAGAYELAVSDLQFPAGLGELVVGVTKGPELVGQIFGSAGITFNAQPGEYSIGLLAKPATGAEYGTWGFTLSKAPLPTVTFSAAPASVAPQGTATLTWSSTGATACVASNGWTGARAVSGTATSSALATQTTFTITCTGPGGSASASATVNVSTPADDGGGGGQLDVLLLALAAALWVARVVAQQKGSASH